MDAPVAPISNQQTQHVSVGEWIITILLTSIPIVNIIMLFVWGFGSATNPSKANWAKAMLIWVLIWIVLGILFFGIFAAVLGSLFNLSR